MKKILCILSMSLLLSALCSPLEIKGKVLSPDESPVKDAVILHRSSMKKCQTDAKGFFSLSVPDEKRIILEVVHPDYVEKSVALSAQSIPSLLIIQLVPYIRQKEEVVVTALRYPEAASSIPIAGVSVSAESLEENMAPNITKGLLDIPGVSNIGSGGFSIVPNIRGLARRRVLILIDYARVTSDRRTGPNASFISPENIAKIEVLRSPSSVFYGSDAIGGVIHIITKKPTLQNQLRGSVLTRFGTANREKSLGFSLEGNQKNTAFIVSFQGNDAENYMSPERRIPQSQFSQASFFGKIIHSTKKREFQLSFLGARGYNIGKPNQDSLTNPTWYPLENQNYFQFQWLEKNAGKNGDLTFQAYLNPNSLETKKEKIKEFKEIESFSKTQSLDYGFHLSYAKRINPHLRISGGTDFFGRSGVKALNMDTSFGSQGEVQSVRKEWPFQKGNRRDFGFFVSADYSGLKRIDLVSGLRLDLLRLEALPGGEPSSITSHYTAWAGFVGGSLHLTDQVVLFTNLARAYRAPSLNELFYSGITGRGFIVSMPDLKPEMSMNLDLGVKVFHKRFFVGLYAFYYEIDDLIERYRKSGKIYTYGNVDKGQIKGWELEMEFFPIPGWKFFGNFFSFFGKSLVTPDPLNDIPSSRLFVGTKLWVGKLSFEIDSTIQQEKKNPGPAEISIPGYETVECKINYTVGSSLHLYFLVSNLLNKAYIARPDPDSVLEPGRSLHLGVKYMF